MKIIGVLGFAAWVNMVLLVPGAWAADAESKANEAVAVVLFDEEADDFTSYRVSPKGFVDVTFARNTPDAVYSEIVAKLKAHPDITGVLAGKTGPLCGRF